MKTLLSIFSALVMTAALAQEPVKPATLIFINGNIYTANEKQPRAEAVAVDEKSVAYVGSNDEVKKFQDAKTRVIDLHGAAMLPGLTDAHYHFIETGMREMSFNLENTKTKDEFLAKVKAQAEKAKPGEWIIGSGWIETFWKPARFPTRGDLDKVAPNNPVMLSRADLHASVVNSAALKLSGITKRTKNPFGGKILHDEKTGEPDGMLIDDAQNLVREHLPQDSDEMIEQAMLLADKVAIEHGLTQVQEPGGYYRDVEIYKKLYAAGKLKTRVYKAVWGPSEDADKLMHEGLILGAYDHHFTLRAIKVSGDGALGSRGAYLLAPYKDAPLTSGILTVPIKEYETMLRTALKKGIQVQTHAIGDAANRFVMDEYENAFRTVPVDQRKMKEPRWRVEHAQIVSAVDLPRFAKLNVIPSMQPSHAISDLHYAPQRLGLDRLKGAYAWQSFIKSGAIVPGGSDAPVERGDPMIEFYAAVARKDIHGFSGDGWHLEQAVTREQALKMFTIWPAYAVFEEHLRGSIEPGKLADFTVLSADIMKIPEGEILQTRCIMTVIDGEIVYQQSI